MGDHHDYDHDDEIICVAPGFRFYPTEEELISFYLHQKLQGQRQDIDRVIPEVYIYNYNPWELPNLSGERCRNDPQLKEWFFFIPKQEKEVKGGRPNRLTNTGYWKATGSQMNVYSSTENKIIGVKKSMVFYKGKARSTSSSKTDWKMNEYLPVDDQHSSSANPLPSQGGDFTVCRVYIKSKCLRAFDRRPPAPPPPLAQAPAPETAPAPGTSRAITNTIIGPQHETNVPQPLDQAQQRGVSNESSSASEDQANNNTFQATNNEQTNNIMNMELDLHGPNFWECQCDWDYWMMLHWNI